MSGLYKVSGGHDMFGGEPGDTVEADLDALEEARWVNAGLLELAPRKYRVVGGSSVYGADPGQVFEKALSRGEEDHLFAGGHVERADNNDPSPKRRQKENE